MSINAKLAVTSCIGSPCSRLYPNSLLFLQRRTCVFSEIMYPYDLSSSSHYSSEPSSVSVNCNLAAKIMVAVLYSLIHYLR